MFELLFLKKVCLQKGKKCIFHLNESKDLTILRAVNITFKAAGREDDIVTTSSLHFY